MMLSILIPTLPNRVHFLSGLVRNINIQIAKASAFDKVEIITDNRREHVTTGEKRNDLLDKANGKYIWFIDDDDDIFSYSISEVLKACEMDPDVIAINGIMTTDGKDKRKFFIAIENKYEAITDGLTTYYKRWPNHITPMKKSIAMKVKFPHKTIFEDYEWSKRLNQMKAYRTQVKIDLPIYQYKYRTKK